MHTPIIVSSFDLDRLEATLDSLPVSAAENKAALLNELSRAEIVEPQAIPPSVVTMNSTVRFVIENTEEFCLTLSFPRDASERTDGISILSPIGMALLGLSVGSRIAWPRPDGKVQEVKVLEVVYQPERAGAFHQ
jgi:regulator of nucleoside diphosphate kinase